MSAAGGSTSGEAATRRLPLPLVARGLTRRYGSRLALDGVDLVVLRGETVALVGPNGSGKTTCLEIVAGLNASDLGGAVIAGARAGSREARAAATYVADEQLGLDELTIDEHAALLRALYGRGVDSERRLGALLVAFGLESRRHARLGSLSRGLRRQAALAGHYALDLPLVLVDEVTATLDPEAVVVVRAMLRSQSARGGATLLATQDLSFAADVADTVVLLAQGRVVDAGTPSELCDRHSVPTLEHAFLAAVGRAGLMREVEELLAVGARGAASHDDHPGASL